MKKGLSFHLSVHPFSPACLYVFSEVAHLLFLKLSIVLGPIFSYLWQSSIFLKKKWCQKGQERRFFGRFKKIKSLALYGIGAKQKFLWSFNILWKLHAWEKSVSQVMANTGSQQMRFQYSLIVNILLIDWYITLIFGM